MGLALALGGFLNFGEETEGNILNNFSVEHKPASVARAFLATTMVSVLSRLPSLLLAIDKKGLRVVHPFVIVFSK